MLPARGTGASRAAAMTPLVSWSEIGLGEERAAQVVGRSVEVSLEVFRVHLEVLDAARRRGPPPPPPPRATALDARSHSRAAFPGCSAPRSTPASSPPGRPVRACRGASLRPLRHRERRAREWRRPSRSSPARSRAALDPYSTTASTRIVTLFEACPPFAARFSHSASGSPGI